MAALCKLEEPHPNDPPVANQRIPIRTAHLPRPIPNLATLSHPTRIPHLYLSHTYPTPIPHPALLLSTLSTHPLRPGSRFRGSRACWRRLTPSCAAHRQTTGGESVGVISTAANTARATGPRPPRSVPLLREPRSHCRGARHLWLSVCSVRLRLLNSLTVRLYGVVTAVTVTVKTALRQRHADKRYLPSNE